MCCCAAGQLDGAGGRGDVLHHRSGAGRPCHGGAPQGLVPAHPGHRRYARSTLLSSEITNCEVLITVWLPVPLLLAVDAPAPSRFQVRSSGCMSRCVAPESQAVGSNFRTGGHGRHSRSLCFHASLQARGSRRCPSTWRACGRTGWPRPGGRPPPGPPPGRAGGPCTGWRGPGHEGAGKHTLSMSCMLLLLNVLAQPEEECSRWSCGRWCLSALK